MKSYSSTLALHLITMLLFAFWMNPRQQKRNRSEEIREGDAVKHPINCKCDVCQYIRAITRGRRGAP